MSDVWARVAAMARRRQGLISGDELASLGIDGEALRWAVESRRLERRHRGIYALPGATACWRQRAWEHLLLAGPGALLSHASAAHVWGLDGFERPPWRFDVCVPRSRSARSTRASRIHRSRTIPDARTTGGLPVTSVANTLVDLAGTLDEATLEIALARRTGAGRAWARGWRSTPRPGPRAACPA